MKANKRGVSLIVLVITIIIMIIIAGAIILALNGSGIVGRATEAKTKTNEAQIEEDNQMVKMEAMLNQTGKVYEEGEGQNKRIAMILPGLAIKPSGEGRELKVNTIETGLVAVDSNLNEYVWIEVPKTEAVYGAGNLNLDTSSATNLATIESKLYNYSSVYNSYNQQLAVTDGDKWYGWNDADEDNVVDDGEIITKAMAEETPSLKTNNKGCGLTYDEYYALKNKMLSSIYNNGGFWIGRYEAGTDTARASGNDELTIALSQINKYPYNFVTCSQAQYLASKMMIAQGTTSSLMFGVQWSLALKYIVENSNLVQEDMTSNSYNWGNYGNASFTVDRGRYSTNGITWKEYNTLANSLKSSGNILLTTGAADRNMVLNIYDLAGNVAELTLQHSTGYAKSDCACRGGRYNISGGQFPARYRYGCTPAGTDITIGFRVSLY